MEIFDEGLPNPIVIKTTEDFDALGVKDMDGKPYTVDGLMQMEIDDRRSTLQVLSGVVGLAYEEDFLQKVLGEWSQKGKTPSINS
jgi:hypothetical protein